jgi:hypothetical protein
VNCVRQRHHRDQRHEVCLVARDPDQPRDRAVPSVIDQQESDPGIREEEPRAADLVGEGRGGDRLPVDARVG